jgi:hypothetical protein
MHPSSEKCTPGRAKCALPGTPGCIWYHNQRDLTRQNKAARSCGGTSTATSTGDLVFPFPSQTHSVGLCDGIGSDMNCSGAPENGHPVGCPFSGGQPAAGDDPLRSNDSRGSYPPLSSSPHADLALGSDLHDPGHTPAGRLSLVMAIPISIRSAAGGLSRACTV